MRILLTNDDGIYSPGIYALYKKLKPLGECIVVAPDAERSAQGHAITLTEPLRVKKIKREEKFFGYAVSGTPADCVKISLMAILKGKPKPNLVISGINLGPNLGINILYSGTVSGATEGAILGIPSFAISLASFKWHNFEATVDFSFKLAKLILSGRFSKKVLLNVNVPALPKARIKGIKITRQGMATYSESYDRREDPRKRVYYWLRSQSMKVEGEDIIDAVAVKRDYISITPLHYDLTNYDEIGLSTPWKKSLL
ncbi:MAG: stationary phase survival protein SurE [Omnitrophica WOR_2 bacterium SM23_29]|nr:MAG: stationary phase survival protein SurE [Omnitrophica WOR_2 bacterium SM23_29]